MCEPSKLKRFPVCIRGTHSLSCMRMLTRFLLDSCRTCGQSRLLATPLGQVICHLENDRWPAITRVTTHPLHIQYVKEIVPVVNVEMNVAASILVTSKKLTDLLFRVYSTQHDIVFFRYRILSSNVNVITVCANFLQDKVKWSRTLNTNSADRTLTWIVIVVSLQCIQLSWSPDKHVGRKNAFDRSVHQFVATMITKNDAPGRLDESHPSIKSMTSTATSFSFLIVFLGCVWFAHLRTSRVQAMMLVILSMSSWI